MDGFCKKGHRFGQRRPPLTELIQSILVRYPDGGQILKELIQNADDAGATDVNFLYDNRYHGTESLENQELAKFQGPALYCHNNATFKDDDWEGIQNLMRSNKKDDPLKVGRFGIGFNSVYHITDLPGVVSGETVGFLDPHETHFSDENGKRGVSGKRYHFDENLHDHIFKDQFMPFHGVFGCNLDTMKSYDGTLFRFPLRTTPTNLSKKNYTKEMIDNLFHSLQEEASVILLFLKSVERISIHERKADGEIQCIFKVEVAEDAREEVRRKRQKLLNEAKEPAITEARYIMSIQVTIGLKTAMFRWLIVNQIGSTDERIAELATELRLLPWVGMAVPIDVETDNKSSGRIFCFLPLPPDVDCQTGLPVHIHGYFGLTDNRRGLVWPGAECQNTATAEWNELLLKKIAIEVYCKILELLVQDVPCTGIGQEERSQLVYSRMPALAKVQGHWKVLLEPLFQKLIQENQKLFYGQDGSSYSWITLNEGILDRLRQSGIATESREAILRILLNSSQIIITNVPPHVLEIVEMYFSPPRDITPPLLRSVLKSHDVSATSHEDKVLLLGFVLRDNATSDLNGIPLLPLANKQFSKFCPHSHAETPSTSVFVPSSSCKATLLPNMDHRFLNENLPEAISKKLIAMAAKDVHRKNPTQLVCLTKDIILQNLRYSLPPEWFNGDEKVQWIVGNSNHPPESWLKKIWNWIHSSFPNTLSPFEKFPLIELPSLPKSKIKYLGILSQHSKFIFGSDGSGNVLPSLMTSLLTAAGCTVLSNPPYYSHHPDINLYVAPTTPIGATLVLSRASLQTVKEYIYLSTGEDRGVLREFFSRLPESLAADQKQFLQQLPLFDTIHGSSTAVQINDQILKAASPEFNLPIGFNLRKSDQIITSTDSKAHQLLTMLTVEILKPSEVFLRYLFPDIQAKSVYDPQETCTVMLWILRQMFNFKVQCVGFQEAMEALSFVSTDEGQLKKPSELYDPNDAFLSNLFMEEANKFPSEDYADEQVISTLKELGLRTRTMLTANELLGVAARIQSFPTFSSSICKIQAIVDILQQNSSYLYHDVNGVDTLKDKLRELKWLPCARVPPKSCRFPLCMPWFNSDTSLFAPSQLRSKSHAPLVGSSMPILNVKMNKSLQDELDLTSEPPIHQVVAQLKTAVQVWSKQDQRKVTPLFQEMLVAIYIHLSQKSKESVADAINDASLKQWICHGTGFCSPTQVALQKDFPLDLRPQLFLLPEDFNDGKSLTDFFLQHGVRQTFSEEDIISVLAAVRDKHVNALTTTSKEIESDLKLCRSILEWVVKDGKILSQNLQEKVFVPVQSTKNKLVLEPCKKCTYCDRDWLRQGGSEFDIPDDYQLIHDFVPAGIARLLGVPALSTCLLSAETLGFEQTGPYEPVTRRLNNILKEYKEGVGVFKELVQNADDARANKIRFLVDWRHGPTERLLSPGMVDCQGPALWAYNNAVFTDKDFENINKLAGATKVEDLAKIGRFGLGFNAVYHLTDVPSFVSRQHVVIFDPNVNHLESHIHDKSRPGIRINLASNPRPLSAFADQFKPYHDVFGCKTQGTEGEKFHYDGTLFRFPFRTSQEAEKSEICQSVYDEVKVKRIVRTLKKNASLLLLYTQHVNVVELYEVGSDDSARDMKLVLSITKSVHTNEVSTNLPFIEECSQWWKKKLTCSKSPETGPSRSEHVTIEVRAMASDLIGTGNQSVKIDTWLLTSCVGNDSSVLLASGEGRKHGLLPCAGAAAKISSVSGSTVSAKLTAKPVKGEAFCFLPLSIPTGFPVHVNGSFAVRSNRDGIWEKNTSDLGLQIEAQWNEFLLEDASSEAYLQLLKEMKCLSESGRLEGYTDTFHELWPRYEMLKSSIWGTLVKSFYTKMVNYALPLLWSNGKWLDIGSGYILHEDLRKVPGIFETLQSLGENVFQLPPAVLKSLERSGLDEVVQDRTLTLESFFKDFFFPNLLEIAQQLRDPIVCCGLDCILGGHEELESLYKAHPCVTCSADGLHLTRPCDLINPEGPVASLFSTEDHRFPVGEYFETSNRLFVLEKLGMVKDVLSWDDICGRARSVEELAVVSYKRGLERSRNLKKYLQEMFQKIEKHEKVQGKHLDILQSTKFMPLLRKPPTRYTLPWNGSQYYEKQFFSPQELFLPSDVDLLGSCCLVVDETDRSGCGKLGETVKTLMGFDRRQPSNDHVLQQLNIAMKRKAKKTLIESVCNRVYKHFNDVLSAPLTCSANVEFIEKLKEISWLFIEGRFVSSENVAFEWKGNGAPYLYGLPIEYRRKYDKLLRAVGVKQIFEARDFINALNMMSESKKGDSLDDEEIKLTVAFANELDDVKNDDVKNHIGKLPLPDAKGVLCRSEELTIKEPFWLKDRGEDRYVHSNITPNLALALGAKLINRRLDKYRYTIAQSIGQHEKLTDRLKNILKSYPCDSGILKELVQNADDAKATEIHFVYDTRTLPCQRVFQLHADEIQGPALCVYNDRHFSYEDLAGIQNLGIGSKSDDPEKTGQYGVEFNAVYHLTDCPSFLSNDDTLCILDPHCRYAPDATPEYPGRQFSPVDEKFREYFSDALSGYLGQHFELKGSTMFRLPLRNLRLSQYSLISKTDANTKIVRLLQTFQCEAKKSLLFLEHVKKISISKIDENGELKREYEVSSIMDEEDESKRHTISSLTKKCKDVQTGDVPWQGVTYPMNVSDSYGVTEQWLIHKCVGVKHQTANDEIPNGRPYGLLPRGGVAALVSSNRSPDTHQKQCYSVYCFLPLPVDTSLPVHVNGHFALDPARRALWKDTDSTNTLTKWNNVMKSHVLAPGYASLILEAQNYIPYCKREAMKEAPSFFPSQVTADTGLYWYHKLFPDLSDLKDEWKILAIEVYRLLGNARARVLPVVVTDEVDKDKDTTKLSRRIRMWLPAQEGFFLNKRKTPESVWKLLLQIHLPVLVSSPLTIRCGFEEVEVSSSLVSPESVINVLRNFNTVNSKCEIGNLPTKIEETMIRTTGNLKKLMSYCQTEKAFTSRLAGLPLLLTSDGILRVFDENKQVYCSEFSDLFPKRTHLFVHPELINYLSNAMCDKEEEAPQVLLPLTVSALASFMSDVIPTTMKGATNHLDFPDSVFSEDWLKRLWLFLQHYAKSDQDETDVSLNALKEWPIIPTKCRKLVTIDNAKTVLDMTERGKKSTGREKKVRECLKKLNCPSLDTDITFKLMPIVGHQHRLQKTTFGESTSISAYSTRYQSTIASQSAEETTVSYSNVRTDRKKPVTDPYVAHPHKVRDILQVLDYMRKAGILDEKKLTTKEIFEVLQFIQDDYENLQPIDYDILKQLPLYKAINNAHYSLSSFSSYALVPGGVPAQEIEKLQRHTGCLFLHSDALPTLERLLERLGAGAKRGVSAFYAEYILPHFSIFSYETQLDYLTHIRDAVLSSLYIGGEKEDFLNCLKATACIPAANRKLHHASDFYDPRNSLFRIMLDEHSNKFPPSPFNETEWLAFLANIGLQSDVNETTFLEFSRKVAIAGNQSQLDETNRKRSKELVRYLLTNHHLHESWFLSTLSTVKFIASEKVEDNLLSLHKQYQCSDENQHPPFLQFSNSVPWKHRTLVWSSASLLPTWEQLEKKLFCKRSCKESFSSRLKIRGPSVDTVISHLQNISGSLAQTSRNEEALPQPRETVKTLMDFDRRQPSNDHVLQQLNIAMKRKAKKALIESVCNRVYKHFNDVLSATLTCSANVEFIEKLKEISWLFIEGRFVSSENVAFEWKGNGAPYLYGLPIEYRRKYDKLLRAVGVKQIFEARDFINALNMMSESKKGDSLDDEEIKLTVAFANELDDVKNDDVKNHIGKIPLPDAKGVLCRSEELTIKEPFWLKDRGEDRYVHSNITPNLALALGAKLINRRLDKYRYTIAQSIGQHEKLTDRLKNILKSYPCDSGILKELVQNADDAKATEIHFVYDTRTLPCQRVFQLHADEIQGPALCVYNDRHFSYEDLAGIQNLGIGSKSDDPEKTGQYGVGFNAVYHLTDCPSFLSNDDTLCILDPHCRYAPDATPEYPGRQFSPVDEKFREYFSDVLSGYLGQHFELKGSTMFRLPLRNRRRSQYSLISKTDANTKIVRLLQSFQCEAKKSLLFLEHVKKISISKIDENGELKREYEVSSIMDEEDESKRHTISSLTKKCKDVQTGDVPWQGVTYPMNVSDSYGVTEQWLIHKCVGVKHQTANDEIPNGRPYGLLPRGGVAALVSSNRSPDNNKKRYSAYCFLPLPVDTSLPVHVNGHFALNPARRALWKDTDSTINTLTKWNNVMKSHVLAPGYASLILEAQNYMPYCKREAMKEAPSFFPSEVTADTGLYWYHKLFPDLSDLKDEWKILAIEVYRLLGNARARVLPVVVTDEVDKYKDTTKLSRRIRMWLPPQEGFFLNKDKTPESVWKLLLQVHLPVLVSSPLTIRCGFEEVEVSSSLVSPESVINVLRNFNTVNSKCEIGNLPTKIEETMIRTTGNLKKLMSYCQTEKAFTSLLAGLPLLLTSDGILRVFDENKQVYCSEFSDLFPKRTHLFVHPELINYLSNAMCDKEEEAPQVLLPLTVSALASFMSDVIPTTMKGATNHLDFPDSVFSEDWLRRLWLFLQHYANPDQDETDVSLDALKEWPIIPTKCRKLVTIDNAKTVLDMTEREKESVGRERKVRECLKKLNCPSLDTDITFKLMPIVGHRHRLGESTSISAYSTAEENTVSYSNARTDRKKPVTDPYVAHPHKVRDILQVLDYMRKAGILDEKKLTTKEIFEVLQFIQDDYENLQPIDYGILKKLPLYKAINNAHYSLSSFSSYALVPGGVPAQEIEKLQRHTGCLFLHSDALPTLERLLEGLGAGAKRGVSAFYAEYILPHFSIFSYETQLDYLTHIRDAVLPSLYIGGEKEDFLNCLKATACIPAANRKLHHASDFYDPRNSLFRIMLDEHSNKFPQSPFNETKWLEFLENIGLQSDVNETTFLEFSRKVAIAGNQSQPDETNRKRSKELVRYLLTNHHLHESWFLSILSTVKFIASEKVEDNLLSLHKQYQCIDENQHPPFLQFSNSVPWKYRTLVWSSASLLPKWEQYEREISCEFLCKKSLSASLNIRGPSVDTVISHLQNISGSLAQTSRNEEALPQPKILKNMMTSIYEFFKTATACPEKDISQNCKNECQTIGKRLNTTPCILVEDDKVLVRGDQLSFTVIEKLLLPFHFVVPREYGIYEHILKRLGATEEITSFQLAKVFETMKIRCKESEMNPEYESKARDAMFLFFKAVLKESSGDDGKSNISHLTELYLPSEDKRLIKSSELLSKVPPRHTNTVAKLKHHFLLPFEKCELRREKEDKYLQALPEHLRPKPFYNVIMEQLDPSCLASTCQLCGGNKNCEFIEKHIRIMKSKEFQDGIVRLLKHQKNSNELTEDEREKSSRFSSSKVEIKCMETIKIHLVLAETNQPLQESTRTRPSYVVKEKDCWTLYIQHENGGNRNQSVLSKAINKILNLWQLTDGCLLVIADILSCDSPSHIAEVLNSNDIKRDFVEEELYKIGHEVPVVCHYLMQQNPLFVFHKGELVAFGEEMKEDCEENLVTDKMDDEEGAFVKYILAKVITCVTSSESDNTYDFNARYLIDLGNDQSKEVSVLDLYKFYQNDPDENPTTDVVVYTGDTSRKPTNMDEAKREIVEALRAAWRLPPHMRRKVIGRLYLRWHPDKNPNNVEFATEMMAFLLSEIKRMEEEEQRLSEKPVHYGFEYTFRKYNNRARRERETFRNYRSCYGGSHYRFSGSATSTGNYTNPNPTEARRWLEQSENDLEAAQFLLTATRPFNALACFLSHQIVEKSLKAALYAKCGLTDDQLHTHDVYTLAQKVNNLVRWKTSNLVELAVAVASYYLPTRYPNRQPSHIVPVNAFSYGQSVRAVQFAADVLRQVKAVIDTR